MACAGPKWLRAAVVVICGAVVLAGFAAPAGARDVARGQAQADPVPGDPTQSIWGSPDFSLKLKNPTYTYTQKVLCSDFTPAGQATLYPYNVPEGSPYKGQFAYRNHSTDGVTVNVNPSATSDLYGTGIAFFVTSLHYGSDEYWFKMSIQCQSNNWQSQTSVSPPTLNLVKSTWATLGATFSSSLNTSTPVKYYVEYGTQTAHYTVRSVTSSDTIPAHGSITRAVTIAGLQPDTTYHYRVVMVNDQYNITTYTNYSGADQTFTTNPA